MNEREPNRELDIENKILAAKVDLVALLIPTSPILAAYVMYAPQALKDLVEGIYDQGEFDLKRAAAITGGTIAAYYAVKFIKNAGREVVDLKREKAMKERSKMAYRAL